MKILTEDGTDITEPVQILYDMVCQSMEWGSGLLDNQEMETVIDTAILLGFQVPPLPSNISALPVNQVGEKYPDHYEIERVHQYPDGRYITYYKRKESSP